MARIQFKNVTKHYGDVIAVRNLNIEIKDREFVVLLGPSGCGKSTTLNMIAGLEEITDGELWFDEQVVNALPPHRRDVAMVFQSYALYPHKTVYDNIAFGLRMRKMSSAELDRRVREAAVKLEITQLLERRPSQLSGGQRQRVALGRAMVRQPAVFLMDEPLSNLDAALRISMRAEIKHLHTEMQTTFVYVTHDQAEALAMSDHVAVMSDGVIAQRGPPPLVYSQPATKFVATFLGTANLLRARILVSSGHTATVALDGGAETVQLEVPSGLAAGDWVDVVFRPEDTVLSFTQRSGNALPGTLERVSFQGGLNECHVRVGPAVVRSNLHPSITAQRGDQVWVSLDPKRCVVFAA